MRRGNLTLISLLFFLAILPQNVSADGENIALEVILVLSFYYQMFICLPAYFIGFFLLAFPRTREYTFYLGIGAFIGVVTTIGLLLVEGYTSSELNSVLLTHVIFGGCFYIVGSNARKTKRVQMTPGKETKKQ